MVFLWLTGDLAKLVFYFLKSQPIAFVFCAGFQAVFDILILSQFFMFRNNVSAEKAGADIAINE